MDEQFIPGTLASLAPQEVFRRLALTGKDHWNAWRGGALGEQGAKQLAETLKLDTLPPHDTPVNFSGVNFTTTKLPDFSGMNFGAEVQFGEATFGNDANFSGATFPSKASFKNTKFGKDTQFIGAIFGAGVSFDDVRFGEGTNFDNATFGYNSQFDGAKFEGDVNFSGQPQGFRNISFARCHFAGLADFSDREFKAQAIFRDASFSTPPVFANVSGAENIDPTGMTVRHIGNRLIPLFPWRIKEWTTDTGIAVRVRQLRKLMEESKAHDVERRLFIVERKLERGPLWKKNPAVAAVHTLALLLFGALSNHGRSIVLPLIWLIGTFFCFHALTQRAFNNLSNTERGFSDDQLLELSIGNVLPIFGTLGGSRRALLNDLFGTNVPAAIEWLSIAHSLISVALIFLFLLAIRNLFKIG